MKKLFAAVLALAMIASACGALAEKGFTVRNVNFDTATLAKAAVPEGYRLVSTFNCCDDQTCLGYPIRVSVGVSDVDNLTMMVFYSGENYIQRVSHSYFSHVEDALDQEFCIFMKEYMPAYNYCWYRAGKILEEMGISAQLRGWKDDVDSCARAAKAREDYVRDKIIPGFRGTGLNVEWAEGTAAERTFTFDVNGQPYCISVYAEGIAYQYQTAAFNTRTIIWEIPYYYALICPMDRFEEIHDTDYMIFRENTGVNDEFRDFSNALDDQIRDTVIRNWNMRVAASMAYAQAMTQLTFSMVESSLGGSYTYADRFSDYIFDQNDYTTEEGAHVKVSTSYDYVYQSGGSVYFTNDALSIPAGANLLTPN